MDPKQAAAIAAALSGSTSDGEADETNHHSPSPSRSKTPPHGLNPNAAALSLTPISAAIDLAAASDSDCNGESPSRGRWRSARLHSHSPSPSRERSPRFHSDSPSPSRERSPRLHSDADAAAGGGGRIPSPRRRHFDSGSSTDASDEGGHGSPLSSRADAANIKPIGDHVRRMRPHGVAESSGAGSSQRRAKRRRSSLLLLKKRKRKRPPRVWCPEDEITILRALISYRDEHGALPAFIQETGKLHNEIREHLSAKASTTQLSDKVRRLKHKYRLLLVRAKNGQDPKLPTAHDRDVYELSKKVWAPKSLGAGIEGGGGGGASENVETESDEEQESWEDMEDGWGDSASSRNKKLKAIAVANGNGNAIAIRRRTCDGNSAPNGDFEKGKDMHPYLWEAVEELSREHPSGTTLKKAFGVLDASRAMAIEEKLQKFKLSEIKQNLRRMDLMRETVKMVLDALESAD